VRLLHSGIAPFSFSLTGTGAIPELPIFL